MPRVELAELLSAGAHFGHLTRRWNPKMRQFIFMERNGIHILDLKKTQQQIEEASNAIAALVSEGKKILYVGTKKQAKEVIETDAKRGHQYYATDRWLGGMLTNFKTVKSSIKRLKDMEATQSEGGLERMSKKESLMFQRELEKLHTSLGGIKEMGGLPDALFVIDVGFHKIAVTEANKLGIPVVAVVDSNHTPEGIDHVIPGNDDSGKAIRLYARGAADAILEGRAASLQEAIKAATDDEEFVEVDGEDA